MTCTMAGGTATEKLVTALPAIIERRRRDPAAMARAEAKILERKSWHALGGFDPDERRRALDLLGYNRQLVFTGMLPGPVLGRRWEFSGFSIRKSFTAAPARTTAAIADFCSHDRR